MSAELQLLELPSGAYTWNRVPTDPDVEVIRAGRSWPTEADAFDAMIDSNDDHRACVVKFYDRASRSEGTGRHVRAPEVGHPVGPGQWTRVDPNRDEQG